MGVEARAALLPGPRRQERPVHLGDEARQGNPAERAGKRAQLVEAAAEELHATDWLLLHERLVVPRGHLDEALQEEARIAFLFHPGFLPGLVRLPEEPRVEERPSPLEVARRVRKHQGESRLFPPIAFGWGRPMIESRVGATSARMPSSRTRAPTRSGWQ